MNHSLTGPWVAVTGASRGIGRVTAVRLAAAGYRVFALARTHADLESLGAELPNVIPIRMDIGEPQAIAEGVAEVLGKTGGRGVDVLINNAGYGQMGPMEDISVAAIRAQFEVNVFGLIDFTQRLLPPMRRRGRGRIIMMSSIAGRISSPLAGVYCASKFALEALSDAWRLELTPFGIHVVLIEPGPIRTSFGRASRSVTPQDAESPYAPAVQRYLRLSSGFNVFERSPDAVARVIERAIKARNPAPRYRVTIPAHLAPLIRLVPDRVIDAAERYAFGLHRPAWDAVEGDRGTTVG